jgi:DNA-binding transcriptional MerR regulator
MMQANFRGKTFSREDVERAMERFDREFRDNFRRWRTYAVKHNGRDYPPKELLRMLVGDIGNLSGGEPTNRYFRDLGFQIGEIGDEVRAPEQAVEEAIDTSLSLEADLEEALATNLAQLEKGLRLYEEQSAGGRQFDAKAAGRIDLLAVDSQQNLVVVELKAGDADRQVCGQIQAYMGWVKANLAGAKGVRGIIVAHEFTERSKLAATVVPGLSLKKYRVNFVFADA